MEQRKIVGSFESYASGIDFYSLQKIGSLLGIKSASTYNKQKLIPIIRETLESGNAELRMFSRYSCKYYKTFDYLMKILKHFEDVLNLTHEVSDELQILWEDYQEEIS